MAEYKGLTIRIGGDTSQLNSALKASTKAASSLQSQIRQVTRAMRFEPGSLANVDTRMKLTTNRAEALYSKVRLLRSGYDELGKSTVTVGGSATSVKKLAESTENVALAAQVANDRYSKMTENLAARYRELEARAKEAGKAMNLNALSRQDSGETFEKQMAELRELGVVTDEEIQKLREMRATWREAFDSSEAYKAAEQFENMAIDMQRLESEARNAASTVRELNSVSGFAADNWQESTAKIKSMDSALSDCTRQAKAYEAALREDPSNLSAAIGRLKTLANEYDLAEAKASELSRQVEAYKSRLSGVLAEHRNLPQYIQQVGDKWQKAQDELSQAKGEANALHQSLQRLKDTQAPVGEIEKLEAEVREADARVDALKASAREMDAAFETAKECAELQRLQSELSQTQSHAKAVRKQMDLTSLGGKSMLNASTLKSAGMTMYSTLTPAITMLGWRTVTAAQDMDSAYRDMRKTVEGTETQFEELKQAAIDFSKTHVTSAEQLLGIMAVGGELGIATENLEAFSETVSNIATATNYSTDDAATALGQLANITHMTADEYQGFSDALVRLGNNGASTETQIGDIATRIGSMSTIVGMSTSDMLAWSSTLASTGQQSEAAGTAFSKTMSLMETAVAAAGGTMDTSFESINRAVMEGGDRLTIFANMAGMTADEFAEAWSGDSAATFDNLQEQLDAAKDSLQMIADVAHMTSDEFAKAWEEDPTVALKSFIEGLNDIEESGGSADSVLGSIGITSSRQKQAIEGLMQTIGLLDDNLEMSANAWAGESDQWGAAGDAAREAQKKAEGFSGQLSILSNIGKNAMSSLADGATPVVGALTELAQAASDAFDGMDEGQKTLVVVGLGIGALAGPALTMVSTFMTASDNVRKFATESSAMGKAISIMKSGFADAGGGADGFKAKMGALKGAAASLGKSLVSGLATAAVVAAVTIAVAAIADYIRKMREAEEAAEGAGDTIGSALGTVISEQGKAVSDLGVTYDEMVAKMAESNRKIKQSAKETYGNTALIEEYGERVKAALKAYNKGDRSAESMAELKSAIELYNDAAGTSISLSETASGKLRLMKDDAKLTAEEFDNLTASMMNAAKAEFFKESYSAKMEDYRMALDEVAEAEKNAKNATDAFYEASATLQDADPFNDVDYETLAQYKTQMEQANLTLENTKAKLGETTSAMNQYEEGMKLMAAAEAAGSTSAQQWVADNDALQVAIWGNCQSVTGFAEALGNLNLDYETLSANSAVVEQMGASWDGTLASIIPGLADMGVKIDGNTAKLLGLNEVKVGDKTYYVSDDGTIVKQNGKLAKLSGMMIGNKTYSVDDEGTIWDGVKAVGTLKDDVANLPDGKVSVTAITDPATGKVSGWVAKTNATKATTKTDSNTSQADKKVKDSVAKANASKGTISINANTSSFWDAANKIDGSTVGTAYVNVKQRPQSYMGGFSDEPWDLSSPPRMATGGIVTRPTLTSNGWVGEDGAEMVLNWATGGAVIPLTNRKYMEPIARAIALNMGDGREKSETRNVTVYLQYDAGADAAQMANDLARMLDRKLAMEG